MEIIYMIRVLAKQWKMKVNQGPLVYKLVMLVLQLFSGFRQAPILIDWTWKSHQLRGAVKQPSDGNPVLLCAISKCSHSKEKMVKSSLIVTWYLGKTQKKTEMIRNHLCLASAASASQNHNLAICCLFSVDLPLKEKKHKYHQLGSSPPPLQKPLLWWEKNIFQPAFCYWWVTKQQILCSTSYPKGSTWLVYLHLSSFKKNQTKYRNIYLPSRIILTYILIYVHHDIWPYLPISLCLPMHMYIYTWICVCMNIFYLH